MEPKDYEQIGRIYCEIVTLQQAAKKNDLYIGGGMDKDGDFYLTVYDKIVDNRFYGTPVREVQPCNFDAIRAEINAIEGFIAGWAKAREIAALAAQPEVEFDPDAEAKKEPVAVEA
jgi:hypothetical protein